MHPEVQPIRLPLFVLMGLTLLFNNFTVFLDKLTSTHLSFAGHM